MLIEYIWNFDGKMSVKFQIGIHQDDYGFDAVKLDTIEEKLARYAL